MPETGHLRGLDGKSVKLWPNPVRIWLLDREMAKPRAFLGYGITPYTNMYLRVYVSAGLHNYTNVHLWVYGLTDLHNYTRVYMWACVGSHLRITR